MNRAPLPILRPLVGRPSSRSNRRPGRRAGPGRRPGPGSRSVAGRRSAGTRRRATSQRPAHHHRHPAPGPPVGLRLRPPHQPSPRPPARRGRPLHRGPHRRAADHAGGLLDAHLALPARARRHPQRPPHPPRPAVAAQGPGPPRLRHRRVHRQLDPSRPPFGPRRALRDLRRSAHSPAMAGPVPQRGHRGGPQRRGPGLARRPRRRPPPLLSLGPLRRAARPLPLPRPLRPPARAARRRRHRQVRPLRHRGGVRRRRGR